MVTSDQDWLPGCVYGVFRFRAGACDRLAPDDWLRFPADRKYPDRLPDSVDRQGKHPAKPNDYRQQQ